MTNEQIWNLACKSTLQAISDGYAKFPKKITGKSIDKVIKGAYTALSKDILKFPIPEIPKVLKIGDKPYGYIWHGTFYTIEEIQGRTITEGDEPVKVYIHI